MPKAPTPLWDGYEDTSEDDLLDLLERKVTSALDPNDRTVDKRVAKEFAQAIASHEWLKKNRMDGAGYRERLHARADEVRVGSWRLR
jgi:hypothetical protein